MGKNANLAAQIIETAKLLANGNEHPVSEQAFKAGWLRVTSILTREGFKLKKNCSEQTIDDLAIGLAGFALVQQAIYSANDPTMCHGTVETWQHEGARMISEFNYWLWGKDN